MELLDVPIEMTYIDSSSRKSSIFAQIDALCVEDPRNSKSISDDSSVYEVSGDQDEFRPNGRCLSTRSLEFEHNEKKFFLKQLILNKIYERYFEQKHPLNLDASLQTGKTNTLASNTISY